MKLFVCVDSNTCWARAQVFHPALTEVNNKFSGGCSSAGCGLRCFTQSLSNQLAFLLILMVVRAGPQQKRYSCLDTKIYSETGLPLRNLIFIFVLEKIFWRDVWRKGTIHICSNTCPCMILDLLVWVSSKHAVLCVLSGSLMAQPLLLCVSWEQ